MERDKGRRDQVAGLDMFRLDRTDKAADRVIHACARLMADSDPWRRLGRTYEDGVRLLSNPAAEVYAAVVQDEVVGFAILVMEGAFRGYVQSIGVMPAWRGRGVGSQLLGAVERRVFGDTSNVFLCVSSFNQDAQRWYKRMGYEVVGELTDYLVAGHSEILMRKTTGPLSGFQKKPR